MIPSVRELWDVSGKEVNSAVMETRENRRKVIAPRVFVTVSAQGPARSQRLVPPSQQDVTNGLLLS